MLFSAGFSVAALLVAKASAHGAVTSYVIDGTTYPGYVFFSHQQDTRIELIILLVTQATPLPRLLQLLNDNGQTIILPSQSQIRKLCVMEAYPLLLLPMSQVAL